LPVIKFLKPIPILLFFLMKENIVNMILERASLHGPREVFRYKSGDNAYKSISWDSFIEESQKVTRALIALGYGASDNIGIFSSNRPEWVISDIGIIGNRGVVVPFYDTSSKQQLKYIIDETRMKLIFAGNREQYEKALWLLENTETLEKVIVYDAGIASGDDNCIDWQQFLSLDAGNRYVPEMEQRLGEIQSDDLVTIIYTSGTTGESKGVMLSHRAFIYAFKIHDERLDVNDKDVSICFLPLSHVFERTWTIYMLYCGATNVFIDNPREIVSQLPIIKPTMMCTVPRFFEKTYEGIQAELAKWPSVKKKIFSWSVKTGHEYSDCLSKAQKPPVLLSLKHRLADKLVLKKLRAVFGGNIRFMPCAGAAISPFLLRFFHACGIFVNYGYGATETTATVSCFRSDIYDFEGCGSIMPGVQVRISDDGEILISGGTVFNGYYNKPEETGKILIDGWYHSGDKGYLTPEGGLVMTDRIKDLIKTSSGKYVSPQKIELVLGQDPFIEQVIAIGDNRKFITALIVPSFLALKNEAERIGLKAMHDTELVLRMEIIEFYHERLKKIQEEFAPFERVGRFILLHEPFSIQNGMLTNTLKVRRSMLIEQFKSEIDNMYL
jgi:long-chain acyl-CoA synthetase